eukprot:216039-Lingulodinium_polyedra.AAC.1
MLKQDGMKGVGYPGGDAQDLTESLAFAKIPGTKTQGGGHVQHGHLHTTGAQDRHVRVRESTQTCSHDASCFSMASC